MVAVAVCVEVCVGIIVGRGVGLLLQAASASKKSKHKPLVTVRFHPIIDLSARIRVSTPSPLGSRRPQPCHLGLGALLPHVRRQAGLH
jgi:hypothetical protein